MSTFSVKTVFFSLFTGKVYTFNIIGIGSVTGPMEQCIGSSFTGIYIYSGRSHKSRVKSDTKLSNQRGVFFCIGSQFFQESFCTGTGNGSQVGRQIFAVHTDSGVFYNQDVFFFLKGNIDSRIKRNIFVSFIGKSQIL